MAAPKTADEWFAAYGESHQDDTNEPIHWICVPAIFFCVVGLIWSIPVPAIVAALIFYVRLSVPLAIGLLLLILGCCGLIQVVASHAPWPVWQVCLVLFVVAWIGQFIGHKIEGKKPSFFHDLIFLLIGPAWLLHFIYKKLGIRY